MGRYFKLPAPARPIDYMFRENTPLMMKVLEANDKAISQRMLELQKEREALEFETTPQDEAEAKLLKGRLGDRVNSIATAMKGDLPNWRKYRTQILDLGTELNSSIKTGDIFKLSQNYGRRKAGFDLVDKMAAEGKLTGYEALKFKEYYDENFKGTDLAHGGKGVYNAETPMETMDFEKVAAEGMSKIKTDPFYKYEMTPYGAYYWDKHTNRRERLTPERVLAIGMENIGTKGMQNLYQRQRVGILNGVYDEKTLKPLEAWKNVPIPKTDAEAAELDDMRKALAKIPEKDKTKRLIMQAAIDGYEDVIKNRSRIEFNPDTYLGPIMKNLVNAWSRDIMTEDGHEFVENGPAVKFALQGMKDWQSELNRRLKWKTHSGNAYSNYRKCMDANTRLEHYKAGIINNIQAIPMQIEEGMTEPTTTDGGWFSSDETNPPLISGQTRSQQLQAIADSMQPEDCSQYLQGLSEDDISESEGEYSSSSSSGGGRTQPPAGGSGGGRTRTRAYGGDVYAYGGSVRDRYDTGGQVQGLVNGYAPVTQIVDYNKLPYKAKKVKTKEGWVPYYSNAGLSHIINTNKDRVTRAKYEIDKIDKAVKSGTFNGKMKIDRDNWYNEMSAADEELKDARVYYKNIMAMALSKVDEQDRVLYNEFANVRGDLDGKKYEDFIENTLRKQFPGTAIGGFGGAGIVKANSKQVADAYKRLFLYKSSKARVDKWRDKIAEQISSPVITNKFIDLDANDATRLDKLINDNIGMFDGLRLFDPGGNDTKDTDVTIPGGLPGPDNNKVKFSFDQGGIQQYMQKTGSKIKIHRIGMGGDMGNGGAVAEISFDDAQGGLPKGNFFVPLGDRAQSLLGNDMLDNAQSDDIAFFARDITHPVYNLFSRRMVRAPQPEGYEDVEGSVADDFTMAAPIPGGGTKSLNVRRIKMGQGWQYMVDVPNDDGTTTPFRRVKLDNEDRAYIDPKTKDFITDTSAGENFVGRFMNAQDLYKQYVAQTRMRETSPYQYQYK